MLNLFVLLAPILVPITVIYLICSFEYRKTDYYKQTHISLLSLRSDKGRYGEYLIYKNLMNLSGNKRFLFNCYIPKSDGSTTEIDVVLLHDSGIYVFESKNYGGKILGAEDTEQWTQVLPAGRWRTQKTHFFNPIIQNKTHIKWLQKYIKQDNIPIYSFVVFSDRCRLKKVKLTTGAHYVVNRCSVASAVAANSSVFGQRLAVDEMNCIYNDLYPLTQLTEKQKRAHIKQVKKAAFSKNKSKMYASHVVREEKACPECGSALVQKVAKKGTTAGSRFWGCSNFPLCKHTENIG